MVAQEARQRPVNMRSIALPAEHGGWGFLLEPIVLGLLLVPTLGGLLFSVSMLAVFLIHQPLKITLKDRSKGRRTSRTQMAERFVLLYGVIAGLSLLPVLATVIAEEKWAFFLPLMLALPLAAVQYAYDARNQSRALVAELTGALALGAIASGIVLIGCWGLPQALALWGLLIARTAPSILYVRARLRVQREQPAPINATYVLHGVALMAVNGLALVGLLPWLSVIPMLILFARAYHGLNSSVRLRASAVGIREMLYGLCVVTLTVVGFVIGL